MLNYNYFLHNAWHYLECNMPKSSTGEGAEEDFFPVHNTK
jgi:hypothetical protein